MDKQDYNVAAVSEIVFIKELMPFIASRAYELKLTTAQVLGVLEIAKQAIMTRDDKATQTP